MAGEPPLLAAIENVTMPGMLSELRRFFSSTKPFRIYIDDACDHGDGDWRSTYAAPVQVSVRQRRIQTVT
eukprot:scaffold30557_cov133-Isochrysis_galbana.AAC.2